MSVKKTKVWIEAAIVTPGTLRMANNKPVFNFSLPMPYQDGEAGDKDFWLRCTAWQTLAQDLHSLAMGSNIELEGRLSPQKWMQGEIQRHSLDVTVTDAWLISSLGIRQKLGQQARRDPVTQQSKPGNGAPAASGRSPGPGAPDDFERSFEQK